MTPEREALIDRIVHACREARRGNVEPALAVRREHPDLWRWAWYVYGQMMIK